MYVSTSIKAPLTLESTGLAGCLKLSEAELFDALGKGTPCKRKNDAGLYYTFAQHPGAFFSMEEVTVGKTGVFCFGIYGPFAAFFSCSGSDTITREQLEQTLGTEMEIGEQLFFGERNFANFTYQGYDYTIRECTPEGSFRGDVWVTVLPHTDWEPEQGFFDESGQWISL